MKTFLGVVVHTDSPNLTFHETVAFPPVVPLVIDFNDLNKVGRAKITRTENQILADIFIDAADVELAPGADAPTCLAATQDSVIFESENGTIYSMGGSLQQISMMTEGALKQIAEGTYEPTIEELGMADDMKDAA